MFVGLLYITVGTGDYDIVADIRENHKGKKALHHNGFKFRKNKINKTTICWICCKRDTHKCKATASTTEINGTTMMKSNIIEHTHGPEFEFFFS